MSAAVKNSKHRSSAGASSEPAVYTRYRLQAGWIKLGMFVSGLDRPWLDTPFMMQGFLVSSPQQIAALQQYCQFAVVDIRASLREVVGLILERGEPVTDEIDPESAAHWGSEASARARREAESLASAGSAPARTARRPPAPEHEPPNTRPLVRPLPQPAPQDAAARPHRQLPQHEEGFQSNRPQVVRGKRSAKVNGSASNWLLGLFKSFFRLGGASGRSTAQGGIPSELQKEIRASLRPGERLQDWTEARPIESELPRAREALAHGEKALTKAFQELSAGETFHVEPVRDAMDHVVASMVDNPNALLWLANLRDRDERSYRHTLRVALYLVALGRQLGFPRAQLVRIGMIGLLADVGKARLPGAMFEKPGALTAAEYSVVKKHVEHSLAILRESPDVPEELMVGVAQHHERMDGSGYPKGLSGAEISVYGRMAGIADTFAAMTTDRPYAEAMTPYRALTSLFEWADKSFHAPLVEQFVQAIGVFPVGSMIELSSGEVAVVLAHNLVRRLEPRVLVLTDADKQPLADPVARDLLEKSDDEDEQRVYILKGLPPGAYGIEPRDYYIDASQSSDPAV